MKLQIQQQRLQWRYTLRRVSMIAAQACVCFGTLAVSYAAESTRQPDSSSPVAVLDFSVTSTGKEQLAWAGGGIADLLQIELNQAGVVTLDRDFIQAVLREQRLLAESGTAQDRFKLGALLHAPQIITGKVMPLEAGRFRVEATVFSVEAVEMVVTVADEGAYPKEISKVVESIGRKLAEKLRPTPGSAPQSQAPVRIANPESLIMFYRGLNACARGRPEMAVAWFVNSAELDPAFAAPLLWEIKAYEMAGFAKHAAIRREEVSPMLMKLGVQPASHDRAPDRKPVFAILNVAVSGGATRDDAVLAASLAATLEKAVLGTKQARLFAYQNIGEAMAEQDLKLSSLFASQGAPRHGRWLMSDALLLGRVQRLDAGRVAFDLSLVDPLTGVAFMQFQRKGTLGELDSIIATASQTLVKDWAKRNPSVSETNAVDLAASGSIEEEIREMRPAFQQLALALSAVRGAPANGELRAELATAFVGVGRLRESGEEINRRLDALDIHAPKADLTFFGTHRWVAFDVGAARSWVEEQKVTRMVEELLTNYPQSLAAGCLSYNLAADEWRSGHWERAIERATDARRVLEAMPNMGAQEGNQSQLTLIAATYFLEGASLFKLGKLDDSEKVLLQGRSFLEKFKVRAFALPSLPAIHEWGGGVKVAGFGGDRPDIASRIGEQLGFIAQARSKQAFVDYQREADEVFAAENSPRGRRQDWHGCALRIIGILERVPVQNENQFKAVLATARSGLRMVSFCAQNDPKHDAIMQPLARRVVTTVLQKYGVPSLKEVASLPQERLLELAGEVNGICNDAGLVNEAVSMFGPFFNEPYPPEFGFAVLLQLDASAERLSQTISQLAARMPGGERNVAAAFWLRLAQQRSSVRRYGDALVYYRKAVAKETKPENCPGLSTTLVEAALERDPTRAKDEVRRFCTEFQIPPFEPFWFEWFNCGRKHQKAQDYPKAIACYQNVVEFLEHPEQSGVFRLEKQSWHNRTALRWGQTLGEVDLCWSDLYDSRWQSAAYYLAQCLIKVGRPDEAAPLLRRMAVGIAGDRVGLLEEVTWSSSRSTTEAIGVRATEMLKKLHEQNDKANDVPANSTQSQPPVRSP